MRYVTATALVVCLVLCSFAQQPARQKTAKLPYGWSKIGLSDSQKKQATALVTDANAKVAELQRQIDAIRAKERTDLNALLSDDQRAQLRKLLETKAGLDAAPKDKK